MKKRMKTNKNHKRQNTEDRIQEPVLGRGSKEHRHTGTEKKNTLCLCDFAPLFLILVLSLSFGCNSGKEVSNLKLKIVSLTDENTKLTSQVEQLNSENEQLKKQNSVLQSLPDSAKGVNLYNLENVKINNYSGLFDENKDNKLDTLIVRLQPVDNFGDVIKAAGNVEVELWNLNKPENQAQIGKWQTSSDELKKTWNSTLVTNYRLSFDISGKIDKLTEPLTLKVTFTDFLTGKTFYAQKVIEP
jgi:hypothetical protein